MSTQEYSNIIYAFDIETTTTPNGVVAHYLSNFICCDFEKRKNKNLLQEFSTPTFCRTPEDIDKFLKKLSKENGTKIVQIYVHNLTYEFDFLIKNVAFVRRNFDNKNSLFIRPRIPLYVKCKNIEFRCSYRLLNQSLEKIGVQLGFNKLEIDYKKQYFCFSDLPENEYQYNLRDTQITLLAVLKECNKWAFINSVADIPLTSTSFTRKNNKYINDIKDTKEFSRHCNYQRYFSKDDIAFFEKTFSGGYTHANAFFTGQPLDDVMSIDIVSSYPSTMLYREFPNFMHKYKGEHAFNYFLLLVKYNDFDNISSLDLIQNYSRPFKYAFCAKLRLYNVQAKVLKNKNLILPISASKCENLKQVKLDNGRIYSAKSLDVFVTEVDLYILKQFYNFSVINCFELWSTKTYKPLEKYILTAVKSYLYEKSTLKKILSNMNHDKKYRVNVDDFFNAEKNDFIYSDDIINNICALPLSEQCQTVNDNYRLSKNKLNAQYGINVQHLMQDDIEYNVDKDTFSIIEDSGVVPRVLYRDFIKGTYITAYSRLTLFVFALYLIENTNAILYYSDTDSWKVGGDLKEIEKATKEYNNKLEDALQISKYYNVGAFDIECVYKKFCTLGCKKYIVSDGEEIEVTIAGVNKINTSKAYSEIYKKLDFDFDELVDVAFTPCTILEYSVTKKLIMKYQNNNYSERVFDENGDSDIIMGVNMCQLCESDYILMNYEKPLVAAYIDYFSTLQGRTFDFIPTIIFRDESGDIQIQKLSDWKKTLKIYKTEDIIKGGILL